MAQVAESTGRECPLCGQPLYGWLQLPETADGSEGGFDADPIRPAAGGRVVDRCESCGAGVVRGEPVSLREELEVVSAPRPDGSLDVRTPNRRSLQAAIGGAGWAGLDDPPRRLVVTPRALELLLERTGWQGAIGQPPLGRNLRLMWQTLLNALTLRPNFARDALAGRLRPRGARQRATFAVDAMVSVLAAPLLALLALPLELVATLLGRGGELRAIVRRRERSDR